MTGTGSILPLHLSPSAYFILIFFLSFRTTLCLQYPQNEIGLACILLATLGSEVEPPSSASGPNMGPMPRERVWLQLVIAQSDTGVPEAHLQGVWLMFVSEEMEVMF